MLESTVENKLRELCKELGVLTFKTTSVAHRGFPDRVLMCNGRTMFLELKTEKGKLFPSQELTLNQMREHGILALVSHGWEQTKQIVTDFKNGEL